jgi:putative nucleotidyltransferase with HDIG domain
MSNDSSCLAELQAILDISRKITTEPESDTLFQTILESALTLTDAEGGTIYFYDDKDESLIFKYVVSPDPEVAKRLKGMRVKKGIGIVGQVAQTLNTDLAADARSDPRFSSSIDRKSGFQTRSVLTVPLQFYDNESATRTLVGVLQLLNKRDGLFTCDDAAKLESMGGFAATILTKSKLYERLRRQYVGTVASLAEAVDAKDPYTHGHSLRVSAYSVALGKTIELSPAELFDLRVSALLHDIGKIGIPDAILFKVEKLTDEEFTRIKTHISEGARILQPANMHPQVYEGIIYHHERWNGKGYPEGLAGEHIPLFGRIISFADAFDTITTERSYKKAHTFDEGRAIVRKDAGSHFDPDLALRFCDLALEEIAKEGMENVLDLSQ